MLLFNHEKNIITDSERRFSLDPIKVDPSLKNRIFSADGDDTVGEWNGEDINDLVKELDRIEERIDANYNSLPVFLNESETKKCTFPFSTVFTIFLFFLIGCSL